MATFTILYLVTKPGRNGVTRHYWQPSAALRRAGWQPVTLGTDQHAAIAAARRLNEQVEQWQAGGLPVAPQGRTGAGKAAVRRHQARGTVGALIDGYRSSPAWAALKANTRRTYDDALGIVERWAGDAPVASISRKRVQTFKAGLSQPAEKGGPLRLTRAATVMRVARTLFKWGQDNDLVGENPFTNAGVVTPPPRWQVWSPEARAALTAAALDPATANSVTYPPEHSLIAAMVLGFAIGQREGDLLRLQQSQYVEVPAYKMDADVHARLAQLHDGGRVMAIRIRQGKTARWIEVPVIGEARHAVETAIARARAAGCTTILIDERTGRPWSENAGAHRFQRRFAECRARAIIAAQKAGSDALATELQDLQFRDLRRTAVVFLGELGLADQLISAITGHKLETVKKILETYMPRNTAMAARAISLSHYRDARPDSAVGQSNG